MYPYSINCNGELVMLNTPKVMAVVNLTPDSFYPGNRFNTVSEALNQIEKVVNEGANMVDLGAYSSRPGAVDISADEEWQRLAPVLKETRKKYPNLIVSVDTFRSQIVEKAVTEYGVGLINDISGGTLDQEMFGTIARLKVPYILMHMKGSPQTMQQQTTYSNLLKEIIAFFSSSIRRLTDLGAHDVIIDPGFGFAKNLEQNYELMARLNELQIIERPILVGVSRKSMIYRLLDIEPENSLNGTIVLNTLALQKGASILRVHDVAEAVETIKIFNKVSEFQ